jgi:hypothetical protein
MNKGLPFVGCSVDYDKHKNSLRAVMSFVDEREQAIDFQRLFITSKEKQYRDILKYLLKEVHKAVRDSVKLED